MSGPIYVPKGRALEYAPYALNLYEGCPHGCRYCYVPRALHMKRDDFRRGAGVPRTDIIARLARQLDLGWRPVPCTARVFLCFSCDPYQWAEPNFRLAKRAIRLLADARVKVRVLTKNPAMAIHLDGELFTEFDVDLGTTLTFRTDADSLIWEPAAPTNRVRASAMRSAKECGIRTWASLEPVIYPEDSLSFIDELGDTIDFWRIGKLNHDRALEAKIDWVDFGRRASALCDKWGARYMLKHDLLAEMGNAKPEGHDAHHGRGEG